VPGFPRKAQGVLFEFKGFSARTLKKGVYDFPVFGGLDTTGAVNETAAGFHKSTGSCV
jgi:hypothetical protein